MADDRLRKLVLMLSSDQVRRGVPFGHQPGGMSSVAGTAVPCGGRTGAATPRGLRGGKPKGHTPSPEVAALISRTRR